MVSAALLAGNDVVEGQVLGLEMFAASVAVAALLPVEQFLVPGVAVTDHVAKIGALRQIGSAHNVLVSEHAEFVLEARNDQFHRFRENVDSDPMKRFILRCNAGCRTTAERIKHHVADV